MVESERHRVRRKGDPRSTSPNANTACCASSPTGAADGRRRRRRHRSVDDDIDGLLITRNIDYSLPYRVLLSGRGLQIPYLGERSARRAGRAVGAAAPRRVLLGRLLAVQHAVPPRRRRPVARTSSTSRPAERHPTLSTDNDALDLHDRHRERRSATSPTFRQAVCSTTASTRSRPRWPSRRATPTCGPS